MFTTLHTLITRARTSPARLDSDLAAGLPPACTARHAARAAWLTHPDTRRALAVTLRDLVADDGRGRLHRVHPRSGSAHLRDEIAVLADRLLAVDAPTPQGVALARVLALDGTAPLLAASSADTALAAVREARDALDAPVLALAS
jgi:hypothetical protein